MKKKLAITLAAVCLSMTLFGCSEKPVNSDSDNYSTDAVTLSTDSEQPTLSENSSDKEVTVTVDNKATAKYDDAELYALDELTVFSPSEKIKSRFWIDGNGYLYYSVESEGKQVIKPSKLGIITDGWDMGAIDSIKTHESPTLINTSFETAETISLSNVTLVDYCNEQTAYFTSKGNGFTLKIRVYDDGFAYRFADVKIGNSDNVVVISEMSEVILPDGANTFAGGYSPTYEYNYDKRDYSSLVEHNGTFNAPVTAETQEHWILITEADVFGGDITYPKSVLETKSGEPNLVWALGYGREPSFTPSHDLESPPHMRLTEVITDNCFTTPWRVTIISDTLAQLVATTTVDALGEPLNADLFESTDWIKPGKVSWSWWSDDDQGNPAIAKKYIDFASEYGWDYYTLDVGWPAFESEITELVKYADERGVKLILWVNYMNIDTPEKIETLFKKWSEWGVAGVKTDYFESDEIKVLESMRDCAEIGAKYKLMIYYHGCICPNGETRTYPNIMTSEAVLGEEFRKWSETPTVVNCLMYPFTRNVIGSMDYTPSCTRIEKTGETGGAALAKAIIYESSLQHFAANARVYPSFLGLPLLNRIPTVWTYSELLDGYPGEQATFLRSDGKDFYVGSMTLKARTQSISLDFLGEGEYYAYLYHDDTEGNLMLTEKTVTAEDSISVDIADNGGFALYLTKNKMDTAVEENPYSEKSGYVYYECETGNTYGDANISDTNTCSGGKKVGYIGLGEGNYLTMTVTVPTDGEYEMLIYYCSGEDRELDIFIGENSYAVSCPNTGGYNIPEAVVTKVTLTKGDNIIKLANADYYAPDMDRIAVSEMPLEN